MAAEIISIGDELLIGQVVNTNASWMAEQMSLAGFRTDRITAIADDREAILSALKEAGERSEIILVTGGLGPTKDDITKQALCEFFHTRLVFNQAAFDHILELFPSRGLKVTATNRAQAEIPGNCLPFPNRVGTAPGMWFEGQTIHSPSSVFIFMPGVPFEMKPMMTDWVIPHLKERFTPQAIFHKTVLTQGLGESYLSDILEKWEDALPGNIKLAYLPQPGIVRLRLSGTGKDAKELERIVNAEADRMINLIPQYFFGYDDDTLEEIVGKLLLKRNATLSTAESCTGGAIAGLITRVPGSSAYYLGSVIAYSNESKVRELGVPAEMIPFRGAVSEEVVRAMAEGVRARFSSDFSIATSGIAGPGGGTPEKPVGTTWIAVATPQKIVTGHFLMGEDRERNIRKTALQALNMLRKAILEF